MVRSRTFNSDSLGVGLLLADLAKETVSDIPPVTTPTIAPHLKLSLPASAAALRVSSTFLVSMPVTIAAPAVLMTPDDNANVAPVFADVAKTVFRQVFFPKIGKKNSQL